MKRLKNMIVGWLMASLLVFSTPSMGAFSQAGIAAEDGTNNPESIKVEIDGVLQNFNPAPIMVSDRVLVPLREIFEKLGAKISWENSTQKITAVKGDKIIVLKIDDDMAFIGDRQVKLPQPPILYKDRTMVPLRFVSEAFGADVSWDSKTQKVNIITNPVKRSISILGNTVEKLELDKSLTIGYFGGSITDGTGSSNHGSWREKTTEWFREEYPDCDISEINAAIGGTGSELGTYRCKHDLLDKNPDLVFVEYAVNDNYMSAEQIQKYMEGIVRQIWEVNPKTDIVFVYTFMEEWLENYYTKGELPVPVIADQTIADYYGIPSVNAGKSLYDELQQTNANVKSFISDGVHPNNDGYAIYAQAVENYLEKTLTVGTSGIARALPLPLMDKPFYGTTDEPGNAVQTGWERTINHWKGYSYLLSANKPGSELTYKFTGTSIGLYWLFTTDSGNIEWSLDGSAPKQASSFDKYALEFDRLSWTILADNLPMKEHTLHIKVSDQKDPKSKGNYIRLGAFLIGK